MCTFKGKSFKGIFPCFPLEPGVNLYYYCLLKNWLISPYVKLCGWRTATSITTCVSRENSSVRFVHRERLHLQSTCQISISLCVGVFLIQKFTQVNLNIVSSTILLNIHIIPSRSWVICITLQNQTALQQRARKSSVISWFNGEQFLKRRGAQGLWRLPWILTCCPAAELGDL